MSLEINKKSFRNLLDSWYFSATEEKTRHSSGFFIL